MQKYGFFAYEIPDEFKYFKNRQIPDLIIKKLCFVHYHSVSHLDYFIDKNLYNNNLQSNYQYLELK